MLNHEQPKSGVHAAGGAELVRAAGPPRRRLASTLVGVVLLTVGLFPTIAPAAAAMLSLPPSMPGPERSRLAHIAERASVETRAEGEPLLARRGLFEYLLDHPAFATHVTQALRFSRLRIWPTPEGLFLDEGWGTTGWFSIVYAEEGTRVIYARGQTRVPVLPSIHGEAVVVINYRYIPAPGGREFVKPAVTASVKLDSRLLAAMLTLGSVLAQRKADSEARGTLRLFAKVSRAIEDDPAGVYAKVRERPGVPQAELEEFRARLGIR
jgi:hypothetical protein